MNRNLVSITAAAVAVVITAGVACASVLPGTNWVQVGKKVSVQGDMVQGGYPVPGNPPAVVPAVFFVGLRQKCFELMPNDALRPVKQFMLLPGQSGLNLDAIAAIVKPTDKVVVDGKYLKFVPGAQAPAPGMPKFYDAIAVAQITVNGQPVPPGRDADRILKLAEKRVLAVLRQGPIIFDGPEARVESIARTDADHVEVRIYFVSGWGHFPMPGSREKLIYTISTNAVQRAGRLPDDRPFPADPHASH